jgi:hypothetical protein
MVVAPEPDIDFTDFFEKEYENVIVYGDIEGDTVLHEGAIRILANGWIQLPTDRLLSPKAVHHIDIES